VTRARLSECFGGGRRHAVNCATVYLRHSSISAALATLVTVIPRLHDNWCQTGCQSGLTTGWMFVYTIQSYRLYNRFDNLFDNRVERTATVPNSHCSVECLYTRYNRLSNRFDSWFQTGLTTGLTTGCIV